MIVSWALVGLCGAPLWAQRPDTRGSKEATALFDRLYAAYAAGDRTVVITQLKTVDDCRRIQPALEMSAKALLDRRADGGVVSEWRRDKAAFVLELANDLSECAPKEFWTLLSTGRSYVMERPTALGADAGDDAFELKWHLIAAAILQRAHGPDATDVYLDTVERRYVTSPAAKEAHTTLDPRFELMRGINEEQRGAGNGRARMVAASSPLRQQAGDVSTAAAVPTVSSSPTIYTSAAIAAPGYLRAAAKAFERVSAIGSMAPEANVRLSAVRLQLGQFQEALAANDLAIVPAADRPLAYWAALWRGRILDAMNRPADAERAYASALDAWPTGQAAGVGLALMRFKQNHRVEAAEASSRVQAMPPGAPDPWWTYFSGDGRFVAAWLTELRSMLR